VFILIEMALPFAVCVLMALGASLMWWQTMGSPWGFLLVSLLAMLGLHRMLQMLTSFLDLFRGGGYFLEHRAPADALARVTEAITGETIAVCIALVVLGMPLLKWLQRMLQGSAA
jgi:hypothetical protein